MLRSVRSERTRTMCWYVCCVRPPPPPSVSIEETRYYKSCARRADFYERWEFVLWPWMGDIWARLQSSYTMCLFVVPAKQCCCTRLSARLVITFGNNGLDNQVIMRIVHGYMLDGTREWNLRYIYIVFQWSASQRAEAILRVNEYIGKYFITSSSDIGVCSMFNLYTYAQSRVLNIRQCGNIILTYTFMKFGGFHRIKGVQMKTTKLFHIYSISAKQDGCRNSIDSIVMQMLHERKHELLCMRVVTFFLDSIICICN